MRGIIKMLMLCGYILTIAFLLFVLKNGSEVVRHVFQRCRDNVLREESKGGIIQEDLVCQAQTQNVSVGPAHIIVLTYMRSGSSFIGDVLQEDPGVFYLFEPLRLLQHFMRKDKPVTYLDGSKRNYSNFLELASDTIQDLSLCRFENIGVDFWQDGFISKSRKAKVFQTCIEKLKIKSMLHALKHCASELSAICNNSKNIVSKIIRIPMYILEPIMNIFPNLKIIHLLRDPRATIKSQSIFRVIRIDQHFADDVTKFCSRVYEDLITAKSIQRKHPSRIIKIMYEDLAKHPLEVTRALYKFAAMNFTLETKAFVENITSAKKVPKTDKECGYICTVKSNSSAQAEQWRLDISFGMVYNIDRLCRPLLKEMKLREIPTPKQLKDISGYPLADDEQKFDDFRWA